CKLTMVETNLSLRLLHNLRSRSRERLDRVGLFVQTNHKTPNSYACSSITASTTERVQIALIDDALYICVINSEQVSTTENAKELITDSGRYVHR
ncbi:MAG: hypothetical protein MPL62_17325, partial [Alphaproteobacteria bacterium]|nr:hypothetical protein [Alphaproteobacteria bacterium]